MGGFEALEHISVELSDTDQSLVTFVPGGLASERAVLLAEVYRRGESWKFRAVGQGWDSGLAGLATDFGITVDDEDEVGGPADETEIDTAEETAVESGGVDEPGPEVLSADPAPDVAPAPVPERPARVRVRAKVKRAEVPTPQLALESGWQSSRLFSVAAIGGQDEQEKRATSALMWTMAAVPPFARSITARAGAPAGTVETFLEVPFTVGDRKVVPDAVIRAARGKRSWTGLVEVKTGAGVLRREQLENYLSVARKRGFDAVLTISNDVGVDESALPVELSARAAGKVTLVHLSWAEIMHELRMLLAHHDITDRMMLCVVSELLRYLEHPRSGALAFQDMGPHWTAVRDALIDGTLVATDKRAGAVVDSWFKLCRQLGFGLTARLGVQVRQALPRRHALDPSVRAGDTATALVTDGRLCTTFKVPGAAGPISLEADVRASRVRVAMDVDAPGEGTATRRVSWLVRQLSGAPDKTVVETLCDTGATTRKTLQELRESSGSALPDRNSVPKKFRVMLQSVLGSKRSGPRGGFVESVSSSVDTFYVEVVESVRPWTPPAPPLDGPVGRVETEENTPPGE